MFTITKFITKKKHGDNQVVPIEEGSSVGKGPLPQGQKPLRKNVDNVTVPSTDKDTPTTKPPTKAEVGGGGPTLPPSSAAMCKAAESALKENSNDD